MRTPRWLLYAAAQVFGGLIFLLFQAVHFITFRRLFFQLEAVGIETLPRSGPFVIAPNHKSYADHFFILAALLRRPRLLPIRFMAADWLFDISAEVPVPANTHRLFRPLVRAVIMLLGLMVRSGLGIAGAYPTRRGEGLDISLRDPLRILLKGYRVAIYPEGGIRYKPGVHSVKIGAVYLAQKSGAMLVPVAIQGIEYLSVSAFFFGRRKVRVIIGEPITVGPEEDLAAASLRLKEEIAVLYNL